MKRETLEQFMRALHGGATRIGEIAIVAKLPYQDATMAASYLLGEGAIVYAGDGRLAPAENKS